MFVTWQVHVWSKMENKYVGKYIKNRKLTHWQNKGDDAEKKIVLHEIRYIGLEKLSAFIGDIQS